MAEKMLIDASHEEETRVVVMRGNRIEEFDFESQYKKQLRGNIYLAKVTRVEPSLQAAFIDYGGNRHGFLAFSEIHPDYYQIPLADRQALLQAEAEEERADAESENGNDHAESRSARQSEEPAKGKSRRGRGRRKAPETETETPEAQAETSADTASETPDSAGEATAPANGNPVAASDGQEDDSGTTSMPAAITGDSVSEAVAAAASDDHAATESEGSGTDSPAAAEDDHDDDDDTNGNGTKVEYVGAEDALEEVPDRSHRKPRKQYRIQEVIKRRQILLVQVVKEERGNKGAALTTYLSLAGRYSVLMPNTARGGGISRKITNVPDRKRLKDIARDLDVPEGMGVILRTAGANRTKAEIKRDFEYLMRLWENVRNLTLTSTAPTLVYEEGSLIKRSIRDLYNKDISEIVVAGEEGYREAKTFMKMLMPSHAKVVQPYRDIHPIYARSGIEAQLDRMLQPQVTLKSGGYIIINQTEALVAVDVNSGRSTKEHSIEDTALQTNLEAAEEVARQLRLRDLAGLIVIDFIDMEEKRNNRSVEKKLKDCLKNDRARIQVGRISHFGLLEMSRQRIRASVLESTTQICEMCGGTGHVRSRSSVALHVIRGIEEYLLKNTTHHIKVRALPDTALYLLNHKRETILELEKQFGLSIIIEADSHLGTQYFVIERGEAVEEPVRIDQIVHYESPHDADAEDEAEKTEETQHHDGHDEGGNGHKRKRRRRRRGGRSAENDESTEEVRTAENTGGSDSTEGTAEDGEDDGDDQRGRKRRRRGKRGGRRKHATEESGAATASQEASADAPEDGESVAGNTEAGEEQPAAEAAEATEAAADVPPDEPAKPRRRRGRKVAVESPEEAAPVAANDTEPSDEQPTEEGEAVAETVAGDAEAPPKARRTTRKRPLASEPVVTSSTENDNDRTEEAETQKPKKVGWWQRRGFF